MKLKDLDKLDSLPKILDNLGKVEGLINSAARLLEAVKDDSVKSLSRQLRKNLRQLTKVARKLDKDNVHQWEEDALMFRYEQLKQSTILIRKHLGDEI